MDAVAGVLEHFGTKGMKWGVHKKKDAASGSHTTTEMVVTNSVPKPLTLSVNQHGQRAAILDVKPGTAADHAEAKKMLGRDLHSYEKVFKLTTQTLEQFVAEEKVVGIGNTALDKAKKKHGAARHSDGEFDSFDVLAHYGVRGMKWGIRKKRSAPSGPRSADAQQVKDIIDNIHKNGIGAASNADLKVLEGRAKLENKYKDIYPKKKTVVDHGMEIAKRVLLPVAEQQAKAFLNDKAAAALKGKEIVEAMEIGRHSVGGGRHLKKA